jgi:type I restriction enzyme S subunit
MNNEALPSGWTLTSIDQIATNRSGNSKLIKGKLCEQPADGLYPAFSASGQDVWHRSFDEEGPAIIVSAVGARCGKTFKARGKWSAIANTHIVRINESVGDLDYFQHLLNREHYWIKGGSAQPFVRVKATFEQPFPLPPLAEQKRIVAKIEELFSELKAGEESLRLARRQLATYRQSLLKQAFEGKLTAKWREQNPDKLEWRNDLLSDVVDFTSGFAFKSKEYVESGIPVVRISDISETGVNLDNSVKITAKPEFEKFRLQKSDILIAMSGATTGKFGELNSHEKCYLNQRVGCFRTKDERKFSQRFLHHLLHSLKRKIEKDAYGGAQPNISGNQIKSYSVPCPSSDEQREIVRLLDEQFEVIERNEREIDAALQRSEALRQSILHRAFTGKLVPQDPADEPATELLARLRTERAATPKATPRKGINRKMIKPAA